MPTYEYACKSCDQRVEIVQSFNDDPLTTCANCGGELRKVFGAIGIAFKGSGFYRTDSRPAPKEKVESGDGGKAKGGKAGASGTSGGAKSQGSDSTSAASS
jgi:putative FmdB family regulatory protein